MRVAAPVEATTVRIAESDVPADVDDDAPREYARPVTSSSEMDQLAAEAAAGIAASQVGAVVAIASPDLPVEQVAEPPPRMKTAPPALIVEDDAELMSFERALEAARMHTGVATRCAVPRIR